MLRQSREQWSQENDCGETIESAHAEGRGEITVGRIEKKRVGQKVCVIDANIGAICIARKGPALAARVAAGGERVEEEEGGRGSKLERLFLLVYRVGETDQWIGGVDEKRVFGQICTEGLPAGCAGVAPIDFGGGLSGKKGFSLRLQCNVE